MRFTHWLLAGSTALACAANSTVVEASGKPIGRITAAFGQATIEGPSGPRAGDLHSTIGNDEKIVTRGAGVTVLLVSRVVLKIDADSAVAISDSPDQTHIVLEHGTIHVFVGQRPTGASIVTIQDPLARMETRTGVVLASYDPRTRQGYYACEHNSVRMEPSHLVDTHVEPRTLTADTQVLANAHLFSEVAPLDRQEFNQRKQSLDRLVHSTRAQGAQSFRVRARAHDTDAAISSLAAAGWIDKNAIVQPNPTLIGQPAPGAAQQAAAKVTPTPPPVPIAPQVPPRTEPVVQPSPPASPAVEPPAAPIDVAPPTPPPVEVVAPPPPPVEIVIGPTLPDPVVVAPPVAPPPIDIAPVVPPVIETPIVPPIDIAPVVPPVVETPIVPPIDIAPVVPPVVEAPVIPPIDITPDLAPPIDLPQADVPVIPTADIQLDPAAVINPPVEAPVPPVLPDVAPRIEVPDLPPTVPPPSVDVVNPATPEPTDPILP